MMATYDNIHTIPADEKVLIAIRFMLDVQEYHLELLHVFAEKLVQVFAGDLESCCGYCVPELDWWQKAVI